MWHDATPMRMEVAVSAGPDAPAVARAAAASWLSAQVSAELLSSAQLLLSELVSNSVRHGQLARDATIDVSVEISNGFVRLQVEEPGAADAVIAVRRPDREHGGGFGLFVVDALAERWGSKHDGSTCVWAELAIS
jgi:anti-sigma regulatory factor (Ser/Thr protein kinase)